MLSNQTFEKIIINYNCYINLTYFKPTACSLTNMPVRIIFFKLHTLIKATYLHINNAVSFQEKN